MESIYALNQTIKKDCVYPDLQQNTVSQFLHLLFQKSKDRNMSILLDFHSIYNVITEYPWYNNVLTQEDFTRLWKIVIREFQHYSNLIGIDIKNEPHGTISLQTWLFFVTSFIQEISTQSPHFQGLFFIEGIQQENSVWGGSINHFPNFTNPRIVLSPHVYGVSVRGTTALYDNSMQWDIWFGNRKNDPTLLSPICIGEIGGTFIDEDWEWQQRMLYYLLEHDITDFYFWGLTPNSYDVGGILDTDWTNVIPRKIWFCQQLQKDPTFIIFP
jgi:endoglucanase